MIKQKKLLFFIIILIYSSSVYAGQEDEPSRILLFFGRFHPLLLHLPIGALLLTFFMEIVGKIRNYDANFMIVPALAFTAFFTVLTSVLGYFLSLEGGYGKEVLQIHMYAGFGMTALTCLLYLSKKTTKQNFKKAYMPIYLVTLLITTFTGHYGSILTHGDTFLTAYSPIRSSQNQKVILEIDSLYYYTNVITPILEDKCVQCHNDNKTKGELNLTTVNHIMNGGENGKIIKPKFAIESPMFTSLKLPFEEDAHMPPTGKPQLTTSEIWLIKHWIDSGADFNKQIANYSSNDTLNNYLKNYLVLPLKKVKEPNLKDIKQLKEDGFTVKRLVYNQPFLSATFTSINQDVSKSAIKNLLNIADQLIELNLHDTKITDEYTKTIQQLKNLKSLRLDNTKITDETLNHLKNLSSLKSLNLFNTAITSNGLSDLLKSIAPEKVYFDHENEDSNRNVAFNNKNEKTIILQGLKDDFIEITKLEKPSVLGKKSIFEGEISVELKGALKGEKIYFTLDGKEPDSTSQLYHEPFFLKESAHFKAKSFKDNWLPSSTIERSYSKVKHKIKDITVKYPPNKSYSGVNKLIDLERGSIRFRDEKWNGYLEDLVATVDLGEEVEFSGISVNCLESIASYIFFPLNLEVYAGNNLNSMKRMGYLKIPTHNENREARIQNFMVKFKNIKSRYIKIKMKNLKTIPEWHEGAGAEAYIFIDEIMVL